MPRVNKPAHFDAAMVWGELERQKADENLNSIFQVDELVQQLKLFETMGMIVKVRVRSSETSETQNKYRLVVPSDTSVLTEEFDSNAA